MYKRDSAFGYNILTEKVDGLKEKPYTDDTNILQSILFYSIDYGTVHFFKSTELSKDHLLKNCKYFQDLYKNSKTNENNRPYNIDDTVVRLLSDLEYLQLVDTKSITTHNKKSSKEYRFTNLGRMIGLMLHCLNTKIINSLTLEKTFSSINEYYGSLNNSHSKFLLIYFKFCKKERMFGDAVLSRLINILMYATDDKEHFLNKINFLDVFYRNSLHLWQIFKKSLYELSLLNNKDYEMFLYNFKLAIEAVQEYKCKNQSVFEMGRYYKLKDVHQVVLEGFCKNCGGHLNCSMNILGYLGGQVRSCVSKKDFSEILCDKCNKDYIDFEIIT